MQDGRLKLLAKHATGFDNILDVGYAEIPNPYLKNKNVIGIDLQKKNCPNNYTRIIQDNAYNIQKHFEPNSLDCIIAGEFLEHIENPILFLRLSYDLIKPGGKLIISTPNPMYPPEIVLNMIWNFKFMFDETHVFLYPQRWLVRMFNLAGFNNVLVCSGGMNLTKNIWIPFPFKTFSQYSLIVATKE